jgi:hypothetical protein
VIRNKEKRHEIPPIRREFLPVRNREPVTFSGIPEHRSYLEEVLLPLTTPYMLALDPGLTEIERK